MIFTMTSFDMGVHTVTYYVNVYIYREILFYVNVIICDYSPMMIGQ